MPQTEDAERSLEVVTMIEKPGLSLPETSDVSVKRRGPKKKEPDDALVEEAAEFIKEQIRQHLFQSSIEIGQFIFLRFYQGKRELVSSKNPKKTASLRKLAERPDLPVTFASLHNMVRVAVQEEILKENGIETDQLHYTHRIKLLAIEDPLKKAEIAQRIIHESLSIRGAWNLIKIESGQDSQKSGNDLTRYMRILLENNEFSHFNFKEGKLRSLNESQRSSLKDSINKALQRTKAVAKNYRKVIEDIEAIEQESLPPPDTNA